ncbi:MAG: hypothetical protein K2H64_10595, partial [Desulfovibrio sp.]|nr:hypothetical protein [Desulfovibrio sp.]
AVKEAGVVSPLAMAGMGKTAIRQAARATGMERWDQKARPCLLTRFAYGLPPDEKTLERLALAEDALEKELGPADFRLRLLPRPLLQIAAGETPDRAVLLEILEREGFSGAEIETVQNPGGYFDREIAPTRAPSGHCEKRNID